MTKKSRQTDRRHNPPPRRRPAEPPEEPEPIPATRVLACHAKRWLAFFFAKISPMIGAGLILLVFTPLFVSMYVFYQILCPPQLPVLNDDPWWGSEPILPINETIDLSIRPFEIKFSDKFIKDLNHRLLDHRVFVRPIKQAGFNYGFSTLYLMKVIKFWTTTYPFKEREEYLNTYPQFRTKIQGLNIHFIHMQQESKPKLEIYPLLLLHSWPSSPCEFYKMIPLLYERRNEYGFVFELVIPSLPGFGFSDGPVYPDFGPMEAATVLHNLMLRIGYEHYFIHSEGGIGSVIGSTMATMFQRNVLGLHLTNPALTVNSPVYLMTLLGSIYPAALPETLRNRMYPLTDLFYKLLEETGYLHMQITKPDTIGVGLTDSPAALAAYILEKFALWSNFENKKTFEGNLENTFELTDLLDNVMIYWLSNSITTSMRFYAESFNQRMLDVRLDMIPTNVPTWGIRFKNALIFQPDNMLRLKYYKFVQSSEVNVGGHFGAWEFPHVMALDIYEAVKAFVPYHSRRTIRNLGKQGNLATARSVHEFIARDIRGNRVKLEKYRGNVLIIVNIATRCSLAKREFKELSYLLKKYYNEGLRVLAFPCNQFLYQQPESNREILEIVTKLGLEYDFFEKVEVNGDNAHPLWRFLKREKRGVLEEDLRWNFHKFIVDKRGIPVERLMNIPVPNELEKLVQKYLSPVIVDN